MHTDIKINDKYKSSVRLDSLSDNYIEFVDTLIVHGTLQNTLQTISGELQSSAQRAFTITGPYGSGKSTLAAFLSGVIGVNSQHREASQAKLSAFPELKQSLSGGFSLEKGWAVVKHVCSLNDPADSIAKTVSNELEGPSRTLSISTLSNTEALKSIEASLNKASKKHDGVLILLDELGKALDYQSNNDGDLYFFQELADLAQKATTPVIIIGFLHQAFSQYAKGKNALTQQEWAKVQGRYRDLSYNPTIDESLVLIGNSIKVDDKIAKKLTKKHENLVKSVVEKHSKITSNEHALVNALPLDPLVSLLLGPISRRRFSQNERSIFGFLASSERYGFRWFIEHEWTTKSMPLYSPDLLWEYLESNLGHLINSSPDGKAWLEALDSLHRASQKGTDLHVSITTLIALISIFGQAHQLFATKELLQSYFELHGFKAGKVSKAIAELEEWAIVIFRKRHNAFFIFQGSDIDVNNLVIKEVEAIQDGVLWANECSIPTHILASKHYHQNGAMRWANTAFIEAPKDISSVDIVEKPKSGEPFTTFVLIGESVNHSDLLDISKKHPSLMLGVATTVTRLKSAAVEKIAINNVFKREQRLAHDHIARKELSNRLNDSKMVISEELDSLFQDATWYYNGKCKGVAPLSQHASSVAEEVYELSPVVINELVNRSKPSGSANSATNKLLLSMLNSDNEKDLGFDKESFPPEKGIYLSVLKSKGWHQKTSLGYGFTSEWPNSTKKEINDARRIWQSGFDFIKRHATSVTIVKLYDHWMKPPYGLTFGLCRIYALALLKSLEGKIAFYDKDSTQSFIFIPQLDEVFVEKLHKYPHEVAVRYFEINTVQTHVVKSIATAAQLQNKEDSTLLELAQHIVQIIHTLPAWVKKTSGHVFVDENASFQLSGESKALRNSAIRANDPYKLILEDIPTIFNLSIDNRNEISNTDELSTKLKAALDELVSQHDFLINGFKKIIKRELSSDFNEALIDRSNEVAKSAHRPAIKEFAKRLSGFIQGSNDFETLISTALGVAERNWTDKHISNGLYEVYNLCRQFRREESFNRMTKVVDAKSVGLITSDNSGSYTELEGHITNVDATNPELDKVKAVVAEKIEKLTDDSKRELLVHLLAELMQPIDVVGGSVK